MGYLWYWGVIGSSGGYSRVLQVLGVLRGTWGYSGLQGRIVLKGLQGTKGLTDGRVQGTAVHRVLQGA